MKINDFKIYNNRDLRLIRNNLSKGEIDSLPEEIIKFIRKENAIIGNENTRILRCIRLIDEEIITRFINNEIC